jgi:predicted enzyme related to lactoylglutathione lyase
LSNRFVWVDIPVLNLERPMAFYAKVLGAPVTRESGPVIQPVHHIGPHGNRAIVLDSESNRITLHAPAV